jgi:sensor c-di-GMP phosphodiesterase-like protein
MRTKPLKVRERVFFSFPLAAIAGVLFLCGITIWILWQESVETEEKRVVELARVLGERTEQIIVHARDMLNDFNNSSMRRCSAEHSSAMHEAAIARPYIRAISYWRAAQRVCGVGYIQSVDLKPSRADRIYDSGVIA